MSVWLDTQFPTLSGNEGELVSVSVEVEARDLEALAPDGRIVVIATQGGSAATLDVVKLMHKRALLTGTTLRPRPLAFKAQIKSALQREVWPLFDSGTLRPVVDRVFAFEDVAAAHAYMESGAHQGKIVLDLQRL